jgi:hypothetical protein
VMPRRRNRLRTKGQGLKGIVRQTWVALLVEVPAGLYSRSLPGFLGTDFIDAGQGMSLRR